MSRDIQRHIDLFKSFPDAILIFDQARQVVFANARFEEKLGYSGEDVVGYKIEPFFEGIDEDLHAKLINANGETFCARMIRKDGSRYNAEIGAGSIHDGEGNVAARYHVIRDASASTSPNGTGDLRYRSSFRAAPAKLIMLDAAGSIVDVTDRFVTRFGRDRDALVGMRLRDLVSPEFGPLVDVAVSSANGRLGRTAPAAMQMLTARGDRIDVEVSVAKQADGLTLAALVDVTERNRTRAALESRNEELERVNENLQSFASIASHDMQEPLRKIRYFSEMLQSAMDEDNREDVDYALGVLSSASQRASRLVGDLLSFSRSSSATLVREPIDIGDLICGLVEEIRNEDAARDVAFEVDVAPLVISGDRTAVLQLLRNLIGNAIKYRVKDRAPRVAVTTTVAGESGQPLHISVADNGIGFDPQFADTILKPFRRLHAREEFPGSGIGLAICETVARRHGWKLFADGRPGDGATFTVEIPDFEQKV